WHQAGEWRVRLPDQPTFIRQLTPDSGQGREQVFELQLSDEDGTQDIDSVTFNISRDGTMHNSCRFFIEPGLDRLNFFSDHPYAYWVTTLSQPGVVENAQCGFSRREARILAEGNTLTIRMPLLFRAGLTGRNVISVEVRTLAGVVITRREAGVWIVPEPEPNNPPQVLSLERTAAGERERVTASFSDPDGYGHLASMAIRIVSGGNACGFLYDRVSHTFQISTDDGSGWEKPVHAQSGNLENGVCSFAPWQLRIWGSGERMNLQLDILFKRPMPGDAEVWLAAVDRAGAATGWVKK
ncbi:MAG: hypothetical protein N2036_07540, partial [Bryobacteraceae bacterium]|nr:hypothetical protein [Bryobacteraceae bacterium]